MPGKELVQSVKIIQQINPMSTEESQFNVQGYNIVTILKRLEAATSRLEDITIFQEEANKTQGEGLPSSSESKSIEGTDVTAKQPEPIEKPKSVKEFEFFIKESIDPFVETSNEINSLLGQAATAFGDAFKEQSKFLDIASKSKKPDFSDPSFLEILNPINQQILQINTIKDSNRSSEFYNHLNTVSEGAPVLGWIVSQTPGSLIPEFKDSAQFWSNRVMKDYREKDAKHVQWVKQFLSIFENLKAYVKEYHPTGPTWDNNGKPLAKTIADDKKTAKNAPKTKSAPSAPSAPNTTSSSGAPPPPPPPPPASLYDSVPSQSTAVSSSEGGSMNAVFADLNKGENITSGLKKVDKSEMTHKNPELRNKDALQASKKPTPPKKPTNLSSSSSTNIKKKPAKKELIGGSKWIIENFTASDVSDNQPIVIEAEMHQSIFIGNTNGITVQVKGKANAISLSETNSTGVVVDSLISGIDVIKSFKYALQVLEVVPMISIDKSDEGTIYLSKASVQADTQIFTSSTTALNINVPTDEDYDELAAPEQFRHTIKNGKLVSEVVEHVG